MIEIIVNDNGTDYNIASTALIQDFIKEKYIPETDKLLDWRLYLMKAECNNQLERNIIKKELLAVDYILNLKQKHEKQPKNNKEKI